jgi:hypothetical protein
MEAYFPSKSLDPLDPEACREECRRFLELLEPDGVFCFQTLDDAKVKNFKARPGLVTQWHSKFDEACWGKLQEYNGRGSGCYVTVNATDGLGRTKDNIVRVRALFIDCDVPKHPKEMPPDWHLPPDICVIRDVEHAHFYWLTADLETADFETMQKALIKYYGSDPSICDLPRVMRLPGLFHRKGAPIMVTLLERGTNAEAASPHSDGAGSEGADGENPGGDHEGVWPPGDSPWAE